MGNNFFLQLADFIRQTVCFYHRCRRASKKPWCNTRISPKSLAEHHFFVGIHQFREEGEYKTGNRRTPAKGIFSDSREVILELVLYLKLIDYHVHK